MTDRPQPPPGGSDGPTRDVRLTPLPDVGAGRSPSGGGDLPPLPNRRRDDDPVLGGLDTDQLAHGAARPRERTLAFSSPEMGRRPVGPVSVGPSRRWPWVVLLVLPVLVIAGATVALFLLLRGA